MVIRTADRRRDLAAIHIFAEQLGMDTSDKHPGSEYRQMLLTVGGPTAKDKAGEISSGNLDHVGRSRVRAHLYQLTRARGIKQKDSGRQPAGRPTPAHDRLKMVKMIRGLLREAGRKDEYADGMAVKMFHVERFEWCVPDQLRRIIAALQYDRGRRAAQAARAAEGR